ncbi:hypothetical protein P5673_010485 [Acropora cervicornis]|uniref:Uncharacterized protein n=1 Tax=Acropora cervicornis TaxID=6130 RepID=A0AAD9QQE7_ACRCE|nr:hypothetical protein P5673_010485 [Acropora cervicornis]
MSCITSVKLHCQLMVLSPNSVRGSKPLRQFGCLSFMMGQYQTSRGRLALRRTLLTMTPGV